MKQLRFVETNARAWFCLKITYTWQYLFNFDGLRNGFLCLHWNDIEHIVTKICCSCVFLSSSKLPILCECLALMTEQERNTAIQLQFSYAYLLAIQNTISSLILIIITETNDTTANTAKLQIDFDRAILAQFVVCVLKTKHTLRTAHTYTHNSLSMARVHHSKHIEQFLFSFAVAVKR